MLLVGLPVFSSILLLPCCCHCNFLEISKTCISWRLIFEKMLLSSLIYRYFFCLLHKSGHALGEEEGEGRPMARGDPSSVNCLSYLSLALWSLALCAGHSFHLFLKQIIKEVKSFLGFYLLMNVATVRAAISCSLTSCLRLWPSVAFVKYEMFLLSSYMHSWPPIYAFLEL